MRRIAWALATLAALTLAWMSLDAPHARATALLPASSSDVVQLTPNAGPVGTIVLVQISGDIPYGDRYQIEATTVSPEMPDHPPCSQAQPIPGVEVLTSGANASATRFAWPGTLGPGAYWICAVPVGGGHSPYWGAQPFTVTIGPAPTATPAPVPTVVVSGPTSGLQPGATITLHVANWYSSDGSPPTLARVVSDWPPGLLYVPVTVVAHPAPGEYDLQITLSDNIAPGSYGIVLADGGGSLGQVIVPASVTVAGPAARNVAGPPPAAGRTPGQLAILVGGGAALLLAAALALLVPRRRAKRAV